MGITQDKQGIQTESAPEELGVSFLDATNFPDYFKQHLEITSARLRGEEHNILLGEKSDSVAGVIQRTAGASLSAAGRSEAEKKKKREEDTARFLEQIRKLQEEIAAIDLKIKAVQADIDALVLKIKKLKEDIADLKAIHNGLRDGTLTLETALKQDKTQEAIHAWQKRTGKKFDKDAPDAIAILLEIMTEQMNFKNDEKLSLEDRLEERRIKIAGLKEQKTALKNRHDNLEKRLKQETNHKTIETSSNLDDISKNQSLKDKFTYGIRDEMNISSEIETTEKHNISDFMKSISHLKNDTAAYHAAIDSFIRGENGGEPLDQKTITKLRKDKDTDINLRQRIALYKFQSEHDYIKDLKHESDYPKWVADIVKDIPEDLKTSVLALPEIKAATGLDFAAKEQNVKSTILQSKASPKDIHQAFNGKSIDDTATTEKDAKDNPQLKQTEQNQSLVLKS